MSFLLSHSKETKSRQIVEIVDSNNRPLGAMPLDEARRQNLFHRMVLVSMYDQNGKLYLVKKKDDKRSPHYRWDISLKTFLRPGESTKDGAYREIDGCMGMKVGKLRFVGTLPPLAPQRVFVSLYRLDNCDTAFLNVHGDDVILVDHDELAGLVTHCPELLTNWVISLWEQRRLFTVF
jgi:isopentenyl-diphosphate delta-isomerase